AVVLVGYQGKALVLQRLLDGRPGVAKAGWVVLANLALDVDVGGGTCAGCARRSDSQATGAAERAGRQKQVDHAETSALVFPLPRHLASPSFRRRRTGNPFPVQRGRKSSDLPRPGQGHLRRRIGGERRPRVVAKMEEVASPDAPARVRGL